MSTSSNKYAVVIGLDFGTSRSGYAYSWTGAARREILSRNEWQGYSGVYPKTSTQSLYDKDNRLVAWGFEAREHLAHLLESGGAHGYTLAERFKMDLLLPVANGKGPIKKMPELLGGESRHFEVIELIADYLRQLKSLALSDLRDSTISNLKDEEILWCLTIPAIWTDPQKRWMRIAAQKAGLINTNPQDQGRLLLVLEPEAAALYCMEDQKFSLVNGNTFVVLDCGGGTIDITVHEKTESGLREVRKGNGGAFGSSYVDKELLNYLKLQTSEEAISKLEHAHPREYINLLETIDRAKCSFGQSLARPTFIGFSTPLYKILKESAPAVLERLYAEQKDDAQLRLQPAQMKEIFGRVLDGVFRTLDEAIGPTAKFDFLFMVGGFSESTYLRSCIRERYASRFSKIIIPKNPGGAVVEGAVSFGLDPTTIRSRRSRLTYGTRMLIPFEEGRHPSDKKRWRADDGIWYCEDVFEPFVRIGDEVEIGDRVITKRTPFNKDQKNMEIKVYATKKRDPYYTDEAGMELLGTVVVPMPDTQAGIRREVEIQFGFGETEVMISVKDLTSHSEKMLRIDFASTFSSDII